MPSHFKGPLLGSSQAGDGLFDGVPLGAIDLGRSRYKVWVENFNQKFPDLQFQTMGALVTPVGAVAANDIVCSAATRQLIINPGTAADTGQNIQFNLAPTAASLQNALNIPGSIVSTATLMDNQELVWACRFGVNTNDAGFAWDGKVIMGWLTDDTSLLVPTTGVPSIATGGGAGFHIGEDGVLGYFGSQTAVTVAPVAARQIKNLNTAGVSVTPNFDWYLVGLRIKWLDASAGTGQIDYYFGDQSDAAAAQPLRWIGRITTDLPMASTQTYSTSFAILNGPALLSDMALDYVITAITGPGRT